MPFEDGGASALSLETGVPIDGIDEANEHETDKQSHLNHDPETQIQIPGPEVPNNWGAPTASCVQRELGNSMDLSSTGLTVWRPSNPRGAPEFDENGVLLGIESDDEDYSCQQGSQQSDLEEGIVEDDGKMPALVPIGEGIVGDDGKIPALVQDPRN